jgi:dihydroflavonol-4-reductase
VTTTLVTGATGFIGSAVARCLAERGDELVVTVREGSNAENLRDLDAKEVKCDLLDRRAVRRALKDVERVFHVAGSTSLRARDAELVFRLNVDATRLLLEECLRAGVERVTYTSSVAAVGPGAPGKPVDENAVFTAGHLGIPYVNAKHEAEMEALRLAARGLPLVCVNPCVVFGTGDVYGSSTSLVRRFLLGRIPVYTEGAVNIVDVEDVARGHVLADEKGEVGERYILGNRNYTWDRLFADLSRISGMEPPPLRLPPAAAVRMAEMSQGAPVGPRFNVHEVKSATQWWTARNTKAKRELGWTTSPHEDTVEATVAWHMDRESDRLARSRRSQPVQWKLAARAVGAVEGVVGMVRRGR